MLPIILSLLIFSPLFSRECSSQPLAPAVYVFGDSLLDAGNSLYPLLSPASYPPYGINFPTGRTGRWTDGRTFADIIASYLGLPYPPAYRGQVRSQTGYSYASAGCGILPQTGNKTDCLNMDEQLNLFQKTIKEELEPIFDNPTELSQYLANSILIVWAGSNDYLLNYFNGLTPDYNTEEFAQLLIDRLSDKLEILHELGARKLVILEVGPLGCLPVYRKNEGHDETWCDDAKNINATKFNDRLPPMIQNLASTYPYSYFTLGKLYSLADHLFKHPADYGMTNVSSSCCTTGKLLLNIACYSFWQPCANPQEYLFWDGAHPTEASFKILATPCFNGSDVCVPNNIQELVQAQTNGAGYLHSAA